MSIKLKLSIMFLAVALIPILFVGALNFSNYRNSLEASNLAYLQNVAAFKAGEIETYFNNLKTAMEMIQSSYVVRRNLPILARLAHNPASSDFLSAKKMFDEVLPKDAAILGVPVILLASRDGRIVYASNPEHYQHNSLNSFSSMEQKAFTEGRKKIFFSDIFLKDNKPAMLITGPAYDLDNAYIGVIAFELDMTPIYKIVQDTTGLGATGETLLGIKTGNDVLFLTPLRYDPQAALNRRARLGDRASMPIQNAVQGKTGAGQLIDYRGKEVFAAWRYLPELGWGMVAKIDAQEALADVINMRNLIILIMAIISILAAIMALSLAQAISRPIGILANGARILGSGNLDYKIETNLQDEIGKLTYSFNAMALNLKATIAARGAERQRFYDVLETLPVYVVLLTEDYHVLFANKFFRERFGESHGKRCYEYLFQRAEPCENCETYKVLKTRASHRWEWTGPDGRNYDIYDYPFIDTDGSRLILEMGIDITERKRAEDELKKYRQHLEELVKERTAELRQSEERLQLAQRSAGAGVWDWDIPADKLAWSEELFHIFGLDPRKDQAGFESWKNALHPDDRAKAEEQIETAVKNHSPLNSEYRIVLSSGNIRWINALGNTTYERNGNPQRMSGICIDITLRKQTEEELKRTSDYLENLFNYANAPIICWDANFKITRFNHAFENLTGYLADEVIGRDLSMLFPANTRQESLDKIKRTLSGEHWEAVEIPILRKDENIRIAFWNSANVYANDGKTLIATIAQGQDITIRKQTEDELKRSNENLEQFAYVASHDLQEPLRIMASYSELLERRYKKKLDADADQFIDYIVEAAQRMQKLIMDLLAYSRIGRTDALLREVDCNSILDKVIYSLGPMIEKNSAIVTHDTLPKLTVNESSLIQLFQNFVGNAIKFHGKTAPVIHISCKRQDADWLFSVRDNGIGIDEKYKERIFLIFQRLHGREKYPGTGIGLAICKKIVELHGGRIWVESEVGKGTTFYFTIPVATKMKR